MWRIMLTSEQAAERPELRRDPTLKPAERDRVEMVALSAAGWSVAQIAAHLQSHAETVRRVFRRWPKAGWAVVRRESPGPAPAIERRTQIESALRA